MSNPTKKMTTIDVNITEIKPYKKNNKKHPETQVKNIAESIKQFGFVQPLVLDKSKGNEIIIGHGRYLASKLLGLKEVPCVFVDNLTEEEIKKLRLLDNKLNESEWDFEFLSEEIADLDFSGFELDWGIPEIEEEKEIIEDEVPEVDEEAEPICKLGDIWQLGEHRLICGNSTDKATIERLMDGQKADMVFTDPPYGMKKESEGVLNDNLNFDDLLDFNKKWIPLTFESLKDNGSWYCWGIDEPLMDIYSNILKPMQKENKITFRNLLTWDKGTGFGQMSNLQRSYSIATEKCLFVMCGVQGFNNNQDNYFEGWEPVRQYLVSEAEKVGLTPQKLKEICGVGMWSHWFGKSQFAFITEEHYKELQDYYGKKEYDAFKKEYDELKKEYDELKKEYDELKKEYYSTRAYFDNTHDNMNDVWHFNRTSESEREHTGGHATPKPIALCSRAIKSSSREGETVLDLFGGSGSTLIACEQLNRKCYMAELDPKYCDVIIKRWENITNKDAVKINV